MAYAAKADMLRRFAEEELVQLTGSDIGVIDDTVLEQALTDASAEIDGYLVRYDLPLATVPPIFERYCCDIARFFLAYERGMVSEVIYNRYEQILSYLTDVAKGKIQIVNESGAVEETGANGSGASFQSGGNAFGRDTY